MPDPRRHLAQSVLPGTILLGVLLLASPGRAQEASWRTCPETGTGILPDGPDRAGARESAASIDTTYAFNVERQSWTWTNHRAGVGVGVGGTGHASWHACIGARAALRRATVVLENARGWVHVRASFGPLLDVLRRHRPPVREDPGRENP